jgi:DNA polymerase-3 subunit delta'
VVDLFATSESTDLDHEELAEVVQDYYPVYKIVDSAPAALLGVDSIDAHLTKMVNENKVPHAFLFVGPRGVGKATMARRLALALLVVGDKPVDQGPSLFGDAPPNETKLQNLAVLPTHPTAIKVQNGAHPDFMFIGGDNAFGQGDEPSSEIKISDIRKITHFARMTTSATNGWRAVIIDGAERMNRNAQNALLKILEEPPKRTAIILVAHHAGGLLPTIRSRVQVVPFAPLNDADFTAAVRQFGFSPSAYEKQLLSALSENCPGQAYALWTNDHLTAAREFFALWETWPRYDEAAWTSFIEGITGPGSDDDTYRFILGLFEWWVQRLSIAKVAPPTRTALHNLMPQVPVDKIVDHTSVNMWTETYEKLQRHFARTLDLNLERRQALMSARLWLTPGG